jgi:hypothetical protein
VQELLDGVPLVVVGFSPADALAPLVDHLGLTGRLLSDPGRRAYRALGLGRAPVWRVYSPGTLLLYARELLRGHRPPRPVEDTRQMGGDALVVDGTVVRRWRPRSPDDRAAPHLIVSAARGR